MGRSALALAVNAADHNVLYLGVKMMPGISSDFRFFRSQDGGATWQRLEEHHFSLCGWGVAILQPHPTQAGRVYRVADCIAGRNFGENLDQSTNAGETWTAAWSGSARSKFSRVLAIQRAMSGSVNHRCSAVHPRVTMPGQSSTLLG